MEKYTLLEMGKWINRYAHVIRECVPAEFQADNAVILKDDKYYYAIMRDIPMSANEHVTRREERPRVVLHTQRKVLRPVYLDKKLCEQNVELDHKDNSFPILPFRYGNSLYARVVRFELK